MCTIHIQQHFILYMLEYATGKSMSYHGYGHKLSWQLLLYLLSTIISHHANPLQLCNTVSSQFAGYHNKLLSHRKIKSYNCCSNITNTSQIKRNIKAEINFKENKLLNFPYSAWLRPVHIISDDFLAIQICVILSKSKMWYAHENAEPGNLDIIRLFLTPSSKVFL